MKGLLLLIRLAAAVAVRPLWPMKKFRWPTEAPITGKVTMTAGKPIPKGFNLITFPDPVYCGRISTGTGWRILKNSRSRPMAD